MTETTEAETITTVTCHIWHANENAAYMVDADQYDSIEDAKDDAKNEALASFRQDLSEPHRIWFTVAPMPAPKLKETTITIVLPAEPEADPISVSVA